MSPASYRAAPPRVGKSNVTRNLRQVQIGVMSDRVAGSERLAAAGDSPAAAGRHGRPGQGFDADLGEASTARWRASLSLACACPYAEKSPRRRAASPSTYADCASLSAFDSAAE